MTVLIHLTERLVIRVMSDGCLEASTGRLRSDCHRLFAHENRFRLIPR